MPDFIWEAKNRVGEVKKGAMDAASVDAVNQRLRAQGLQPVKVKKKPMEINIRMPGSSGVTTKDLVGQLEFFFASKCSTKICAIWTFHFQHQLRNIRVKSTALWSFELRNLIKSFFVKRRI